MGRIADILTDDDAVALMKEAGLHVNIDPIADYYGYMDHPALSGGTDYVVKWTPAFQTFNLYTDIKRLTDNKTGVPRFCFRIPVMQKPITTTEQFCDVIKNLKKMLDKYYVEIYNAKIEKALEALG